MRQNALELVYESVMRAYDAKQTLGTVLCETDTGDQSLPTYERATPLVPERLHGHSAEFGDGVLAWSR